MRKKKKGGLYFVCALGAFFGFLAGCFACEKTGTGNKHLQLFYCLTTVVKSWVIFIFVDNMSGFNQAN